MIEGNIKKKKTLDASITKLAWCLISAAVIFFTMVWGFYFYGGPYIDSISGSLKTFEMDPSAYERIGLFGDFVGGTLNPIFGVLSLVAILITLLLQSKELSQSTEALQDQSTHLQLQAFENTFFSMLEMNNEIVKSIFIHDSVDYSGRAAFPKLINRLKEAYSAETQKQIGRPEDASNEARLIKESYKRFYNKQEKYVGHYLRMTKSIVDFVVDRAPGAHGVYLRIMLAQMSQYELVILYYHHLSGMHPFICERNVGGVDLFQDLRRDQLIDEAHI
jgi:hypothetical protein